MTDKAKKVMKEAESKSARRGEMVERVSPDSVRPTKRPMRETSVRAGTRTRTVLT
jgi:hypothetical protein